MTPVLFVPVDQLRHTLAPLRGEHSDPASTLGPMPLRVAAAPDGGFEIIDGFKRLMAWQGEGRKEVPAVVEPVAGVAMKARVLSVNAPRKTAGPMDETRVVASLLDDDKLSLQAIAKLLGRKKTWVQRKRSAWANGFRP